MPATAAARPPAKPAPERPTHVAVELRVTTEEAEHLAHWLDRLQGLVGKGVLGLPKGWSSRDDAGLVGRLAERCRQAA